LHEYRALRELVLTHPLPANIAPRFLPHCRRSRRTVRPSPRHAEFAVNIARAVATFLVAAHRARQVEDAIED